VLVSHVWRLPFAIHNAVNVGGVNSLLVQYRDPVWFAKTLADFEINDIAALPPLFCYNS
jgi:hypothetical protein